MPSTALGPHVVGSRVVVRRLLPGQTGPSGGPAFTDTLGICTSWGEGHCVVQPATGDPIEIPLDLIVSGKPVPPRPSVRLRVSARDAESHAGPIWPSVERTALGEWELRTDTRELGSDVRLIKRANSCLAFGDPGRSMAEAAAQIQAFYAERARPALAQVERDSPTEWALRDLGWTPVDGADTFFQTVSLARARRLGAVRSGAGRSSGDRMATGAGRAEVASQVSVDGARVVVRYGDRAVGEAALDGDWLGIHQIWVDPDHRRQGVAWALMSDLLEWGAEQGAATAWLHVETDNAGAIDLYERLGFIEHHTLRYLAAP